MRICFWIRPWTVHVYLWSSAQLPCTCLGCVLGFLTIVLGYSNQMYELLNAPVDIFNNVWWLGKTVKFWYFQFTFTSILFWNVQNFLNWNVFLYLWYRYIEMCLHFKSWLIPEVKEEKIAYQDYSWSTLASDFFLHAFCCHFDIFAYFLQISRYMWRWLWTWWWLRWWSLFDSGWRPWPGFIHPMRGSGTSAEKRSVRPSTCSLNWYTTTVTTVLLIYLLWFKISWSDSI